MTLEPPDSRPLPDLIAGRYRIVSRLGVGGMGIVYKALDVQLNRSVAIKALEDRRLLVAGSAERLRGEAKAAASLDHPYVCKVYELVETPTDTFIVMEYIEGETLASILKRGNLPIPQVLQLGREIAEGLANAHSRGLVHRDVKPSNVMVTPHGHVKLLDFGVAGTDVAATPADHTRTQLPQVTIHAGTPHYMSPEQAEGQPVTARADLFSLGVLLYECITGQLPFSGSTTFDYVRHVIQSAPRRLDRVAPETPADLVDLIERCLEKSPAQRPESADAVVAELSRLSANLTGAGVALRTAGQRRSRQRVTTIVAAVAVVVAAGLGWWIWSRESAGPPPLRQSRPFLTSAAMESNSRISPDTQWVAFLATEGGATRVLVQQIDGGEPRPLTLERGTPQDVIWSPDGRQIMIVMLLDQTRVLQIYPAFFGGASVKTIPIASEVRSPRLLRWIDRDVYVEGRVEIKDRGPLLMRVSTAGAGEVAIINEGWPMDATVRTIDVHPSGRTLAITRLIDGREDLWTANIDGSNVRAVTNDAFLERSPIWNGRGDRIIVQSNRGGQMDLWEIDPVSGAAVQLTSGEADTTAESTSADGSLITFNRQFLEARLWRWSLTATDERQLTQDALSDYTPAVSTDGRTIAFQRSLATPSRGFAILDAKLFTGRFESTDRLTGTRALGDVAVPALSGDGNWIAYLELKGRPAHGVLSVRNLSSGATHVVSPAVMMPSLSTRPVDWLGPVSAWMPDGELWFIDHTGNPSVNRYRPGDAELGKVVVRADKDEGVYFRDIRISADGRSVAYLVNESRQLPTDPLRDTQLISVDVATNQPRTLATLPPGPTHVLLKGWLDGSWIATHRTKVNDDLTADLAVLAIDEATGARRTVGTITNAFVGTAALDLQRRSLILTRVENGASNVYEFSLRTGDLRQITRNTLAGVIYSGFQPVSNAVIGVREERRQDIWLIQPAPSSRTGNPAGR